MAYDRVVGLGGVDRGVDERLELILDDDPLGELRELEEVVDPVARPSGQPTCESLGCARRSS